jgi:hypothetical protein
MTRNRDSLARVHRAFDMRPAESLFGPEAIVRPTTDAEVLGFGSAAEGVGNDVVELEKRRCVATMAVGGNVGAAAAIAFKDEAAHGVRNVA